MAVKSASANRAMTLYFQVKLFVLFNNANILEFESGRCTAREVWRGGFGRV